MEEVIKTTDSLIERLALLADATQRQNELFQRRWAYQRRKKIRLNRRIALAEHKLGTGELGKGQDHAV